MNLLRSALSTAPRWVARYQSRPNGTVCQHLCGRSHSTRWRSIPAAAIHSSAPFYQNAAKASTEEDDPAEQMSPPSERVQALAEEIIQLSMLDVANLTKLLRKKLGIPEGMAFGMAAPMGGGQGGGGAAAAQEEVKVEKTAFDVKLESYDQALRIKLIKEVRAVTGLGLKEAKELVEKVPTVLKVGISKDEANGILEKLKVVGGNCVLE
eukprot:TRINITY_DN2718_c0_g1_i1.p1 TRINITY_DN2718_c0_g1~~TRINITY_DN2718_c0_g1_i1.p1  ORF type:complete len:209 (+),score=49.69 TRINITY_DN2718_c0_g1_i1:493-1119(+)